MTVACADPVHQFQAVGRPLRPGDPCQCGTTIWAVPTMPDLAEPDVADRERLHQEAEAAIARARAVSPPPEAP